MSFVGKQILFGYLEVTWRIWSRKYLVKRRNIWVCCSRQSFAFCN